jgi:anthranilate/para-aminobenzoate synthase component II
MPNPFSATRYHSLVIKRETLPEVLEVTAETDEGEIMGVKHKHFPIWGVQFHPESILTQNGRTIVKNFLKLG